MPRKPRSKTEKSVEILTNPSLRSVYANWAQVQSSANDFKLLFGETALATKEKLVAIEVARIYLTPRVAKALAAVLVDGIRQHEEKNGPIDLSGLST